MITSRTIITVPRDDPKFDEYKKVLTREKGWNIEETSEAVKYERIDLFEFNEERKMIDKETYVVAFMSPKNAKEMSLPDDAQVVTGLLDDDTIIVVPRDEFVDWLFEQRGEE